MSPTLTHPPLDILRAYALGKLTTADGAAVEQHIARCAECARILSEQPADSFQRLAQRAAPIPPPYGPQVEERPGTDGGAPSLPAPPADAAPGGEPDRPTATFVPPPAVDPDRTIPPSSPPTDPNATIAPSSPNVDTSASGGHGRTVAQTQRPTVPGVPPELVNHPRYQVLKVLGEGGMGAVYAAQHLKMDRKVALKVIHSHLISRGDALPRFLQEVRAAAKLSHPNIVQAHDADEAGDMHFLVMEYVEGTDLSKFLQKKGPLPVNLACHFVRQAALGLQHAHEQGMIHRDIKPHNLMLTPKGQVKILDFGLARFAKDNGPANGQLTGTGVVMGTADYIAPEQTRDARAIDIRADIYSLGCTLYQLLSGKVPFPEGSVIDKMIKHALEAPPALAGLRPDLPAELVQVIECMMAKNPDDRFATPADVARALVPFVAGKPPGSDLLPAANRSSGSHPTLAAPKSAIAVLPVPAPAFEEVPDEDELAALPPSRTGRLKKPLWDQDEPRPVWMRPAVLAGAAVLLLAFLAAAGVGVYRIATPEGELVIETVCDDVDVLVKQGGKVVAIIDTKSNKTVMLRGGKYDLAIEVGKDGKPRDDVSIDIREAEIKRGEKVIAVVRRVSKVAPGAGQAAPRAGDPKADPRTRWAADIGNLFTQTKKGEWEESVPNGARSFFIEIDRTPEYIEMEVSNRAWRVRLYAGHCETSLPPFRTYTFCFAGGWQGLPKPPLAKAPTDSRERWTHDKGVFALGTGGEWEEMTPEGMKLTFKEIDRRTYYVELEHANGLRRVRLYHDRCEIGDRPFADFKTIYRGGWAQSPDPKGPGVPGSPPLSGTPPTPGPNVAAMLAEARSGISGSGLNLEATAATLTEVIRLDPKSAEAYRLRSAARVALKDYDGAEADAEQLMKLEPLTNQGILARAWARGHAGKFREAIADYSAIIDTEVISVERPYALRCRGHARERFGDDAGAVRDEQLAVKLDPKLRSFTNPFPEVKKAEPKADPVGFGPKVLFREAKRFGPNDAVVRRAAVSPCGTLVAASLSEGDGGDSYTAVFEVPSGRRLLKEALLTHDLAWGPKKELYAVGLGEGGNRLVRFDATAANPRAVTLATFPALDANLGEFDLAVSPDGKRIAVHDALADTRGRVLVYDPAGKELARFSGDPVGAGDFKDIGFGVRTWNGSMPRAMARSQHLNGLAFSPDGKLLACTHADRTIRAWDIAAKRDIWKFQGLAHAGAGVSFLADGQLMVGGGGRGLRAVDPRAIGGEWLVLAEAPKPQKLPAGAKIDIPGFDPAMLDNLADSGLVRCVPVPGTKTLLGLSLTGGWKAFAADGRALDLDGPNRLFGNSDVRLIGFTPDGKQAVVCYQTDSDDLQAQKRAGGLGATPGQLGLWDVNPTLLQAK